MRPALKQHVTMTEPSNTWEASQPFIRINALCKTFGSGPLVLDNINLTLEKGDFLAIIGPSGCGKSTLLKLLAGLLTHSSGAIDFLNDKLRMGFVFQDANLLPWTSIANNIELPLKLAGMPKTERQQRILPLLKMVKLEAAADLYPRELSGGMRMRASIARALSTTPELLLLDEPFGALDEMTRDDLNEELLLLREQQQFTAGFVTHSVSEAVFLANKVLVLSANPGRIHEWIDIDLPYPRTALTRTDEHFGQLVAAVTRSLHSVRTQSAAEQK